LFVPKIWQQTVRHRGKFTASMPKPRHEIARYLEEITKPVLPKFRENPIENCIYIKKRIAKSLKFTTKSAIDFEVFLSNHALKLINENGVMLICHKLDCSSETFRRNIITFKKNETTHFNFNTIVMK
jgi:hypothetical protein